MRIADSTHIFEVKEFEQPRPQPGFGTFDPYKPIREKINQATRKFNEFKDYPCSVVLANPKGAFVFFEWDAIFGAMLGNLGFQVKFGVPVSEDDPVQNIFAAGGKMMDDRRGEPQNTTISAVIALGRYPLRQKWNSREIQRREKQVNRKLTYADWEEVFQRCPFDDGYKPQRVWVYENPFARIPLSRDLFCGGFDERWVWEEDAVTRIFVGDELLKWESDSSAGAEESSSLQMPNQLSEQE